MNWTKADVRRMREALTDHMLYARNHQPSSQIQEAIDARRRQLIERGVERASEHPVQGARDPGLKRTLAKLRTGADLPPDVEGWTPLSSEPGGTER